MKAKFLEVFYEGASKKLYWEKMPKSLYLAASFWQVDWTVSLEA